VLCDVSAAADDTRDLVVRNDVNGDRNSDGSDIWFTSSSAAPADATSYSDLELVTTPYAETVLPGRQLPPIPAVYDDVATNDGPISDANSSGAESESGSEIFPNTSPLAAAAAAGGVETSYSGLSAFTRDPPPIPGVYDELGKHDYYNIDDKPQSDSESLLSGRPLSEMEAIL